MTTDSLTTDPTEPLFVTSRGFNAPRDLVFQAFTQAERLMQWWGPKGFTMASCEMDLRPGGAFHYCLRSPEGEDLWGKWVFREVAAPERLVFLASFSDPEGNVTWHPMSPDWPRLMLSSLTLTEENGQTTAILQAIAHDATAVQRKTFEAGLSSMQEGYAGTFDKLDAYLASVQ